MKMQYGTDYIIIDLATFENIANLSEYARLFQETWDCKTLYEAEYLVQHYNVMHRDIKVALLIR